MKYGVAIDITDQLNPFLNQVVSEIGSRRLKEMVGSSVGKTVRQHLRTKQEESAGRFGKHVGFYAEAARSTHYTVDPDGVTISITRPGMSLRYHGGIVRPVNSKYLTIPARAEAYGTRARSMDNLQFLFGRNRRPIALVETESQDIRFNKKKGTFRSVQDREYGKTWKGSHGGGVMYWLVTSARIKADPTVLPTDKEIIDSSMSVINTVVDRMRKFNGW